MFRRVLKQIVRRSIGRRTAPSDTVQEAEIEINNENFARAEELLTEWLNGHPENAAALRLLGHTLNRQGRHRDALAVLVRALKLRDEPKTRKEIAHAHASLGNISDAFEILAPVLAKLSGKAIGPLNKTDGKAPRVLDFTEKGAVLRAAFLALNNNPAAEACDWALRAGEDANGEYRVFDIIPSLLDYCRQSNLPWRLAEEAELMPMGKSAPTGVRAQAFVGALPEGLVIGQSFIPASVEGFAFVDRFIHNPARFVLWGRTIPSDTVRGVGGTRMLTSTRGLDHYKGEHLLVGNFGNVGHWLLNYMARLWWLDRVPELNKAAIVIGTNAWDSQIECLSRMSIDRERIVQIPEGRIAQFERLWAPAMFYGGVENQLYWWPGIVPFLRDRLSMEFTSPRTRRIFLTRRAARWRRLLNEAELLKALSPFGFEVIDPGALSVAEQITLAGSAQIIAGAFGAGMMLLMFAARGTPIVELKYDVGNSMDIHPVVAREIGLPYFGVIGETRGDEPDLLKRDFLIAPDRALDAVSHALALAGA